MIQQTKLFGNRGEPCQIDNCKQDWEIYYRGYKLCKYHTEQMRKLRGFLGVKHG